MRWSAPLSSQLRELRDAAPVPVWPFFLVADLIVQPTMLRGIKRRVERDAQERHRSSPTRPLIGQTAAVPRRTA